MTEKILIDRELLEELRLCAMLGYSGVVDLSSLAGEILQVVAKTDAALEAPQQEPVGEEVEVVAYWDGSYGSPYFAQKPNSPGIGSKGIPLMTVTQHQRIVGGLKAELEWVKALNKALDESNQRHLTENAKLREALEAIVGHPGIMRVRKDLHDKGVEALAATKESQHE
jgi:hypothetical protein